MKLKLFLILAIVASSITRADQKLEKKTLVVLICSRNNEKLVEKNLASIAQQEYTNYRIIYVDDASTDSTQKKVEAAIKTFKWEDKFHYIRNKERTYKLHNLYHSIHDLCLPHEIVVEIDGDDWLVNNQVFNKINQVYTEHDVWMTYGGVQFFKVNFKQLQPKPIKQETVDCNLFRDLPKSDFIFIALRTFYAGLFTRIDKKDLIDADGNFFRRGSDMVTMYPMFEMAGNRFYFFETPVYFYNIHTGNNDCKEEPKSQGLIFEIIKNKEKYKKLEGPVPY